MEFRYKIGKDGKLTTHCPFLPQTNIMVGSHLCSLCNFHEVSQMNPSHTGGYTKCKKEKEGLNMTEKTWGGARPGSGRKPADPKDKRVQMVITIDRETRDKLKAISQARKMKVGRIIDEMVKGEW